MKKQFQVVEGRRGGVRIGNWFEEAKDLDGEKETSRVLSFGANFASSTTFSDGFQPLV